MWNEQILVVTLLQLIFNSVSVSNVDFLNTELGKTYYYASQRKQRIIDKRYSFMLFEGLVMCDKEDLSNKI